ncbi:hypothetical protein BGX29_003848 [Mortierella sp. GBA35]|nr:hypothetical protein BGX29_003848 [Mortierella sp. GBA35]
MDTQADSSKIHGSIQTTTGRPEAAPEVLLTRGCSKRSLAAMEPEFVDSNTLDAHAPSSSVLQSDYLIIDDNDNLGEHLDMSGEVHTEASPASSTTSSAIEAAHTAKRVRYSLSDDVQPTAVELSVLQPVIQPDNKRELGGQLGHGQQHHPHHDHHHHRSVGRGRSVADLLPSSTDVAPVDMDEDASAALGDPVDSSSRGLAMEVETPEEEHAHAHSHGPVSGRVNSTAFLEPKRRATEPLVPAQKHSTSEGSTKQPSFSTSSFHIPSPERKRSLSVSSSSTGGHLADKKGLRREVKIQLLDEMESKPILEEARRASIDQLRETRADKKHVSDAAVLTAATQAAKTPSPDEETVLPKEDPTIHDWDQEELEDEEESTPSPASLTSGNVPREETIRSLNKRQRQFERDRRRAAFEGGSSQTSSDQENNSDLDDDNDDPFLDPERDSAFMSEAQEADTHNVHLRLENQREFQDAAGLDLGEEETSNINEDGQYGGMIEDDDEGEDFWENR